MTEDLKAQYIQGIYITGALLIREAPFILQSGKKSHIYLNHRNFLSQHIYLSMITQLYAELAKSIPGEFMLGAVDSVMSPIIVGAMSLHLKMDYVVVKRAPLTHGTQEYIYGKLTKPVLLIDDMTSTGDSLIDAAEKIRHQGGIVTHAIISAYREEKAINNLKEKQITCMSIASFAEIIESLLPTLSAKELQIVQRHPLIFNE